VDHLSTKRDAGREAAIARCVAWADAVSEHRRSGLGIVVNFNRSLALPCVVGCENRDDFESARVVRVRLCRARSRCEGSDESSGYAQVREKRRGPAASRPSTLNQRVGGSSPPRPTISRTYAALFLRAVWCADRELKRRERAPRRFLSRTAGINKVEGFPGSCMGPLIFRHRVVTDHYYVACQ
jgi:hypothetical protein